MLYFLPASVPIKQCSVRISDRVFTTGLWGYVLSWLGGHACLQISQLGVFFHYSFAGLKVHCLINISAIASPIYNAKDKFKLNVLKSWSNNNTILWSIFFLQNCLTPNTVDKFSMNILLKYKLWSWSLSVKKEFNGHLEVFSQHEILLKRSLTTAGF